VWPWKISFAATTSVHVVQRNADDVTLQCTTDQIQIIWRIGDQPPFEAASYGGNGSFITNIINTTVTECTTIVCTGTPNPFDRQIPESDVLLLCPLEVSTHPPTGTLSTSMAPGASTEATDNITHPGTAEPTYTESSDSAEVPSSQSEWWIIVGCVVGGVVLFVLVVVSTVVCMWGGMSCWKKKCIRKTTGEVTGNITHPGASELADTGTTVREAKTSVPVQYDPPNDPALPCGSCDVVRWPPTRQETSFQLNSEELIVSQPRASNLRSQPQRASRRTYQFEGIVINHVDNLSPLSIHFKSEQFQTTFSSNTL